MNYTWGFPVLGVVYNEDNLQNVIQTVNWTLTATEVSGDTTYTAYCYGSIGLPAPSPASFTPYEQVTEAQVQAWTEEALGAKQVASLQAGLAGQIENQKNPTGGNLPPPWVQP